MPKHVALGMAVRHLSGSAQIVGLLNGFGYSVSHSFVLEHDTALTRSRERKHYTAILHTDWNTYDPYVGQQRFWTGDTFGKRDNA